MRAAIAAYLDQQAGWSKQAACVPLGRRFLEVLAADEAVNVCQTCPVQQACLAHAITTRAVGVVQAGVIIGQSPIHPRTWTQL